MRALKQINKSKSGNLSYDKVEVMVPFVQPQYMAVQQKANTILSLQIQMNKKDKPVFNLRSLCNNGQRFHCTEQLNTNTAKLSEHCVHIN